MRPNIIGAALAAATALSLAACETVPKTEYVTVAQEVRQAKPPACRKSSRPRPVISGGKARDVLRHIEAQDAHIDHLDARIAECDAALGG